MRALTEVKMHVVLVIVSLCCAVLVGASDVDTSAFSNRRIRSKLSVAENNVVLTSTIEFSASESGVGKSKYYVAFDSEDVERLAFISAQSGKDGPQLAVSRDDRITK